MRGNFLEFGKMLAQLVEQCPLLVEAVDGVLVEAQLAEERDGPLWQPMAVRAGARTGGG